MARAVPDPTIPLYLYVVWDPETAPEFRRETPLAEIVAHMTRGY